jgi:hypothetical protein
VDEAVLDVARSIRRYLPSLVGDHAEELDQKVASLLRQAHAGEDVEDDLLAALESSPETHNWAAAMLGNERGLPPGLQATRSGNYSGLPGAADPVDAIRYICPVDRAYAEWQLFVGDPILGCPDHPGTALVLG